MSDTDRDELDIDLEEHEDAEEDGPEAEESEGEGPVAFSFGDDPEEKDEEAVEETPVIRDFRKREKEKDRRIRLLERENETLKTTSKPPVEDPGAEPDYEVEGEQYDWDANEFNRQRYRPWLEKRAQFEQAQRDQEQATTAIKQAYEGAKASLNYPDMTGAEERVFTEAGPILRDILVHAKAPALVAALDANPDQLKSLCKITNTVEAILAVGELRGKLKVATKPKRRPPAPDEPARGSGTVAPGAREKQIQRLEAEADRTGDRSKLIAYRAKNK